jgi:alkaline phosphatase D
MPVVVRVFENETAAAPLATFNSATTAAADRTATVRLTGLEPSRTYSYDVLVDSQPVGASRVPFRTSPPAGKRVKFDVIFGGCAGYTPQFERMWNAIAAAHPAALLMLGDNVYIDLPEQPGPFHKYTYYCRQSRPEWRRLVGSTPVYAIWDDHDCAIDDIWMGPYLDRPAWKAPTLELFKQNWNNPAYGDERAPGCWFRFAIGDVDFFMLDCRFYRTNPFAPQRTMLGPVQKSWLLEGLQKSKATFKVIASSVPWASGAKPGSRDTWDGFPEEREEIFSAIEAGQIGGVLLLSADRHRSEAWKIERPRGYPLYNLSSARLTNIHTHECVPGALFCYNEKCSFGLLNFDTEADEPLVVYKIVNIDGQTVHELKLHRNELEF